MGRAVLTSKGFSWFQKGHPWIFRNDLERLQDVTPGGIVALEKKTGECLARGFYSDRSKIALRIISRSRESIDEEFWRNRIAQAFAFRQGRVEKTNAYRLIYGESDGLPSLVVDRYGEHLVLQTLSQGTELLLPLFTKILQGLFHPSSMILRNDLAVRELEGLPREKKILAGEFPPRVKVFEGEMTYQVDLWNGQKTGAYLDQRENRLLAGHFLRGKILDAFCYQGLFALQVARNSSQITAIDSSEEAIAQAGENALLNGFSHIEFRKGNVFDLLKAEVEAGTQYDGIILDPPAFAKSKENVGGATRGYKELNLRALRLLNPGGILVTASCSYNLSEGKFLEILQESARDVGATLRILAKRTQSADHPILLSFPESYYLKCLFLEKVR